MEAFPELSGLQGATLVLPAVSVGTVGQLAVDLLVSTLQLHPLSRLEDPSVLPCIGIDAISEGQGQITTALELYGDVRRGLYMLQQRAPVAPGCQKQAAASLVEWIHSQGFAQVVVLASLDGRLRRDAQLGGSQLRYLALQGDIKQKSSSLGWKELEEDAAGGRPEAERLLPPWPLIHAARTAGLNLLALMCFAIEGNNVPDAVSMAESMQAYLSASASLQAVGRGSSEQAGWRFPESWKYVYGRPDDHAVY